MSKQGAAMSDGDYGSNGDIRVRINYAPSDTVFPVLATMTQRERRDFVKAAIFTYHLLTSRAVIGDELLRLLQEHITATKLSKLTAAVMPPTTRRKAAQQKAPAATSQEKRKSQEPALPVQANREDATNENPAPQTKPQRSFDPAALRRLKSVGNASSIFR